MAKLQLTLACGDYDFLRPLINGEIQPQGIELNVLTMASPERHGRMLKHEEFDVCELSLVGYLVSRDKGCGYNAIPVFPHRRFRHQYMVKRTGCGIEKPSDLNGKRIALDTLQNSAGLWMRGILQDHYNVDLKTIEWWCQEAGGHSVRTGRLDERQARAPRQKHRPDANRRRTRSVALSRNPAVDARRQRQSCACCFPTRRKPRSNITKTAATSRSCTRWW